MTVLAREAKPGVSARAADDLVQMQPLDAEFSQRLLAHVHDRLAREGGTRAKVSELRPIPFLNHGLSALIGIAPVGRLLLGTLAFH